MQGAQGDQERPILEYVSTKAPPGNSKVRSTYQMLITFFNTHNRLRRECLISLTWAWMTNKRCAYHPALEGARCESTQMARQPLAIFWRVCPQVAEHLEHCIPGVSWHQPLGKACKIPISFGTQQKPVLYVLDWQVSCTPATHFQPRRVSCTQMQLLIPSTCIYGMASASLG